MFQGTSLAQSFHARKIRIGVGLTLVAGIVFIAGVVSHDARIELAGNIAALVSLMVLLWLGLSVICPACKLRLLFHAMRTHSTGKWLGHAIYDRSCPRCGFEADVSTMSYNKSLERTRGE
jgi:hypothetical protein